MPIQDLRVDIKAGDSDEEFKARKSILSKLLQGEWASYYKGRGIEFAGFRAYTSADDASLIDWKASLRSKDTLIREFEELKTYNVVFVLDVSDSMLFTSREKLKVEYAAELTYHFADAVVQAGDGVGLAMVNSKIQEKVMPTMGGSVLDDFKFALLNGNNYGGNFDMGKAISLTRGMLDDNSIVVIVSDFFGMGSGWEKYIYMMRQDFQVLGVMLRDPRDLELPKSGGQFLLQDPYTNDKIYVDSNDYREKYAKLANERDNYIKNVFINSKGDLCRVRTDQDFMKQLIEFFKYKVRTREQ